MSYHDKLLFLLSIVIFAIILDILGLIGIIFILAFIPKTIISAFILSLSQFYQTLIGIIIVLSLTFIGILVYRAMKLIIKIVDHFKPKVNT